MSKTLSSVGEKLELPIFTIRRESDRAFYDGEQVDCFRQNIPLKNKLSTEVN
ncbi:MAG: hypothetical protein WA865_13085 [Spirulinaceae cyanobacterium]